MSVDLSLTLVTDAGLAESVGRDIVDVVAAAISGGVTTVQVREKTASASAFLRTVERVAAITPAHVAPIVNDRVDVFLAARERGARVTGVHVGQSDLPVEAVRRIVGPTAIVGLSASTIAELGRAEATGVVDYVGIGAVHATRTKPDAPVAIGVDGFAALASATTLPAVAIGGITAADLAGLRRGGAAGAAVVSAICAAHDPAAAANALRTAWQGRG